MVVTVSENGLVSKGFQETTLPQEASLSDSVARIYMLALTLALAGTIRFSQRLMVMSGLSEKTNTAAR
jgi:FlaG/FlaF family flagellin (archaellin)